MSTTGKPRLVDTEAAEHWTGRPRGTLYRWRNEGRVTTYRRGARALWDIDELPRYRHLCGPSCLAEPCPPIPNPPPIPRPRTPLDAGRRITED